MVIKKRARVHDSREDINWIRGRRRVCETAALHGNLELLQLARYQYDMPWDDTTSSNAALYGHFHILKFAYHNKCPWNGKTMENAEEYEGKNKESIIQWLEKRGCRVEPNRDYYDVSDESYSDSRYCYDHFESFRH